MKPPINVLLLAIFFGIVIPHYQSPAEESVKSSTNSTFAKEVAEFGDKFCQIQTELMKGSRKFNADDELALFDDDAILVSEGGTMVGKKTFAPVFKKNAQENIEVNIEGADVEPLFRVENVTILSERSALFTVPSTTYITFNGKSTRIKMTQLLTVQKTGNRIKIVAVGTSKVPK